MNRVSKIVFIAAASMAVMAGNAFAEEPAAGGGGGDAAAGGASGGGAAGRPSVSAGADTGVVTKANWPLAGIERPLTAAKSLLEISPVLGIVHLNLGMLGSANGDTLAVAGRYGISDKLELLFAYQGISLGLL